MEELHNCLIAFEILGLQYFSLKSLSKEDPKPKRPSWFRLLYMFFILIGAFLAVQAYGASTGIGVLAALKNKTIIALVIQNLMVIAYLIVIYASVIHSYKTTKITQQIFVIYSEMKKISLEAFGTYVDVKALRKRLFKMTLRMAMFFTLFHSLMMVMDPGTSLFQLLVTAIKNFILVVLSVKLVFYVKMVNENLLFLEKMVHELFPSQPIKIIDNINLHLTYVKSAASKNEPLKKAMAAREIYNKTITITSCVNETVGFSIFLLFVSLVITLTSGGHRIFVATVGGGGETLFGKKWNCFHIFLGIFRHLMILPYFRNFLQHRAFDFNLAYRCSTLQ